MCSEGSHIEIPCTDQRREVTEHRKRWLQFSVRKRHLQWSGACRRRYIVCVGHSLGPLLPITDDIRVVRHSGRMHFYELIYGLGHKSSYMCIVCAKSRSNPILSQLHFLSQTSILIAFFLSSARRDLWRNKAIKPSSRCATVQCV